MHGLSLDPLNVCILLLFICLLYIVLCLFIHHLSYVMYVISAKEEIKSIYIQNETYTCI